MKLLDAFAYFVMNVIYSAASFYVIILISSALLKSITVFTVIINLILIFFLFLFYREIRKLNKLLIQNVPIKILAFLIPPASYILIKTKTGLTEFSIILIIISFALSILFEYAAKKDSKFLDAITKTYR